MTAIKKHVTFHRACTRMPKPNRLVMFTVPGRADVRMGETLLFSGTGVVISAPDKIYRPERINRWAYAPVMLKDE